MRLIEGRQNQIRLMFKHFGRLVEKLKRVRIGFLELGPLKPGRVPPPDAGRGGALPQAAEAGKRAVPNDSDHCRTAAHRPDHRRGGPVGKKSRPSYGVSEYMQRAGYRIIPVNPNETEVLGEKATRTWSRCRRRSTSSTFSAARSSCPEIVDAAIRIGARGRLDAGRRSRRRPRRQRARAAGLIVVMDRCILKEHRRWVR